MGSEVASLSRANREESGGKNTALTELVLAVRQGARSAESWLAVARPRLLRVLLAAGASPHDAEDLVQDTLLSAHDKLETFDARRGSCESWLATIALSRLRNQRRSEGRRLRLKDAWARLLAPITPGPAPAFEARDTLARLLAGLTPRMREVVALYEIAELSAEETARVLGMSAAGVRSIARDARRRLTQLACQEEER